MLRPPPKSILLFAFAVLSAACASDPTADFGETWADEIALTQLAPQTILPSTTMRLSGSGFVTPILGTTRLRMRGRTVSQGGDIRAVDLNLLVLVRSANALDVQMDRTSFRQLCPSGVGRFSGEVVIEVASIQSNQIYQPAGLRVELDCASSLIPRFSSIVGGRSSINAALLVQAQDLLLGESEGTSSLVVDGCYLTQGSPEPCEVNGRPIESVRLPLEILNPDARRDANVLLSPDLIGIKSGSLSSRARIVNTDADGVETFSEPQFWNVDVSPSNLTLVEAEGASLGGYVLFQGSGFIGAGTDEVMEVEVDGIFEADNGRPGRALRVSLITEYQAGDVVRYVLSDGDELGELIDLRKSSGTISGTFTARLRKGADTVTLEPINSSFRVAPIRQVVHLIFTQGFADALARFGMRAAEVNLQRRMLRHAEGIFAGIGVEFRLEKPTDYRLYSTVEITGADPNGIGLIGYDNTPGKDVGNQRLYDQIGGVHAQTQEDGFPGYGGVFLQSFFAFSQAPPQGVTPNPGASELFDQLFDPFRPDRGGRPIQNDEVPALDANVDATRCPSPGDRRQAVSCAIFALGNLLGGTMAHEVAHSLGLADPEVDQFHNQRDRPNHLMDAGFDRPFVERAHLQGRGPEYFCTENFAYLSEILTTPDRDPMQGRTSCF